MGAGKNDSSNIISTKSKSDTAANTKGDSLAKYSVLNNMTLLNAFNFNFSGKLTSSYLGLFNIFAPNFSHFTTYNKKKNKRIKHY
jgi:hypothetical protein